MIASRWTATTCVPGHVARDGGDVLGGHDDRVALGEARAARVDDHHVGRVLVERGADLVAPDRVAGDVDRRLAVRAQHEAGDRREHLRDLAGPVLPAGARDHDAGRLERPLHRPQVG